MCAQVLDARYQPPALRTGDVSGIVLMHRWPEDVVAELAKRLPVVSIVHAYPLAGVDLIGVDDREGVLMLVRHLLAKGHRKIGFFGYCRGMSWARSRYFAYLEALAEQDIVSDLKDMVTVSLDEAQATGLVEMPDSIDQVMSRISSGVTAWIGGSDMLAYSLSRSLLARGLSIPKDVAITGYHALSTPVVGLPQMTSTRVVSEELGAAALRRLASRIDNPEEARRSILLPAEFVAGETT
jgi:LacI family transcriptional regulator